MAEIDSRGRSTRTAHCSCGSLAVTVRGEPSRVSGCSCLACQRLSGSAFTYTAFFPAAAVTIFGSYKVFRDVREAGRWHESRFCPICGTPLMRVYELMPDQVGIGVGCFADPNFPEPEEFFWATSKHGWVVLPEKVSSKATQ